MEKITPLYIGGFFDGDGSILISKNVLQIHFIQCKTEILYMIQKKYGGKFYVDKRKPRENSRIRICGKECIKILQDLKKGSITKYKQILLAEDFLKYIGKRGESNTRNRLQQEMTQLNKDYKTTKFNNEKPYDRINDEYITGLFDAEGNINIKRMSSSLRLKITQKNDMLLLEHIKNYIKCGKIDKKSFCWVVSNRKILSFLQKMVEISIVKKYQLKCFIKIIENINNCKRKPTSEDIEYRKKLANEITEDIHSNQNK